MSGRPAGPGPLALLRMLPRPVHLLIAGVAVNRAGSYVQLFLVLYLVAQGEPAGRAGVALTGWGAGSVLGILAGGLIADRLSTRATIAVSMLAAGALCAAIPFVRPFGALVAVCAATGFTAQSYRPASSVLLARLTPPRHLVFASATYRFGLNAGAGIAPLLGAFLAAYSYTLLFEVNAATYLLLGVLAHRYLPDARYERDGAAASTYRDVAADRRYLGFLAALFVISLVEIQYTAALPLEVLARGLSTQYYGVLVAINGLLIIGVELLVTRYVQNWRMRTAITAGIGLIGLGVAGYGLPGAAALAVATAVWTFGEIVAAPSVSAYAALAGAPPVRGRYIALATASQNAGYAIGPVLGVTAWTLAGGAFWPLCLATGALATAATWHTVRDPINSRETTIVRDPVAPQR